MAMRYQMFIKGWMKEHKVKVKKLGVAKCMKLAAFDWKKYKKKKGMK